MSLTGSEQRFVLAEMIKSSSVDVHALANFVRSNCGFPDWYNMQLPNGRNLNQCIKFAQTFSIPGPLAQHPSPANDDHAVESIAEFPRRHMPLPSPTGQLPGFASATLGHLNLLPRPANGMTASMASLSQAPKLPPKKRGRPSRSELSRRDLLPREPLPIAPRPPLPALGPNAYPPRAILPAMNRTSCESLAPMPLASSPPSLGAGSRGRKRHRLTSPPATPIIRRTPPPPRPPLTCPPINVLAKSEGAGKGREGSSSHANMPPTPIPDSTRAGHP